MAAKWNMVVDIARCDNCRNCFLATKDEHIGNEFPRLFRAAAGTRAQLGGHQAPRARAPGPPWRRTSCR